MTTPRTRVIPTITTGKGLYLHDSITHAVTRTNKNPTKSITITGAKTLVAQENRASWIFTQAVSLVPRKRANVNGETRAKAPMVEVRKDNREKAVSLTMEPNLREKPHQW